MTRRQRRQLEEQERDEPFDLRKAQRGPSPKNFPTLTKSLSAKKQQQMTYIQRKKTANYLISSQKKTNGLDKKEEFKKKHEWKEKGCPVKDKDRHQKHIRVE